MSVIDDLLSLEERLLIYEEPHNEMRLVIKDIANLNPWVDNVCLFCKGKRPNHILCSYNLAKRIMEDE